jgi:hypothetical protein
MAGDWIKVERTTPDKPEVVKLAEILHMDDPDFVLGKLWRFWAWADANTQDGILKTKYAHIDRVVYCPGFARGLVSVGWLQGREGALVIPNFDRHNGNSSKARALEAEAKRIRRSLKDQSDNVSDMASDKSPTPCPTVVRHNVGPEKRREDNTTTPTTTGCEVCQFPQDVSEIDRFMAAQALHPLGDELTRCAERFFNEQAAVGWKNKHGIPLADWRPMARQYAATWARNNAAEVGLKPANAAGTTSKSPLKTSRRDELWTD